MKNGTPVIDLNDLIYAALNQLPYNQQRLGLQAQRYALSVSRRFAPDLAEDLHQDVFSEAFEVLWKGGPAPLASASGKSLFRRAIRKAVRRVRAANAPPGQRTRKTNELLKHRVTAESIGRVLDAASLDRASVGEGIARVIDFDSVADPAVQVPLALVEDRIDLQKLLAKAPPFVERAYRAIHLGGCTVEQAARQADMNRFTLRRHFAVFTEVARAAA